VTVHADQGSDTKEGKRFCWVADISRAFRLYINVPRPPLKPVFTRHAYT
jgi:hypothetical protein